MGNKGMPSARDGEERKRPVLCIPLVPNLLMPNMMEQLAV